MMRKTKERIDELEAQVEHLTERVDKLRDDIYDDANMTTDEFAELIFQKDKREEFIKMAQELLGEESDDDD